MSDTYNDEDLRKQFKLHLSKLSIEQKKQLNSWCVKEHDQTLPIWFSQTADECQKEQLIATFVDGDLSGYGVVHEDTEAQELAKSSSDRTAEAEALNNLPPLNTTGVTNQANQDTQDNDRIEEPVLEPVLFTDAQLKNMLERHGYKPVLEKDVKVVDVHVVVYMEIPTDADDKEFAEKALDTAIVGGYGYEIERIEHVT